MIRCIKHMTKDVMICLLLLVSTSFLLLVRALLLVAMPFAPSSVLVPMSVRTLTLTSTWYVRSVGPLSLEKLHGTDSSFWIGLKPWEEVLVT